MPLSQVYDLIVGYLQSSGINIQPKVLQIVYDLHKEVLIFDNFRVEEGTLRITSILGDLPVPSWLLYRNSNLIMEARSPSIIVETLLSLLAGEKLETWI